MIQVYPEGISAPQALIDKVIAQHGGFQLKQVLLLAQDLNQDGIVEWVQFDVSIDHGWVDSLMWVYIDEVWQRKTMRRLFIDDQFSLPTLKENISEGNISVLPAKWQRLKIGDTEFQVYD